jgi:hypothetical protein
VGHDSRARDAEHIQQADHVADDRRQGVGLDRVWLARPPESSEVRGDGAEARLGQDGDLPPPEVGRVGKTMEE